MDKYQKGKRDQKVPEVQPSGEPYDPTVDDEKNHSIFVIYRDQSDYPGSFTSLNNKYSLKLYH